jgi:hypothetical protein
MGLPVGGSRVNAVFTPPFQSIFKRAGYARTIATPGREPIARGGRPDQGQP